MCIAILDARQRGPEGWLQASRRGAGQGRPAQSLQARYLFEKSVFAIFICLLSVRKWRWFQLISTSRVSALGMTNAHKFMCVLSTDPTSIEFILGYRGQAKESHNYPINKVTSDLK
jgi:hypothetical protein